jgi:hypothetical protein
MSMAPDTIAVPAGESPESPEVEPSVVLRSPLSAGTMAATFEARGRAVNNNFLELLDDALRLG